MNSRIPVKLNRYEVLMGANIGMIRQINGLFNGKKNMLCGDKDNAWSAHIDGAVAEVAVAKHFGVFFPGTVDVGPMPDVGEWQVRWRSQDHYELIIREPDKEDDIFILVTGTADPKGPVDFIVLNIRGWIWGREAKQKRFWKDVGRKRMPAWFVPVEALHGLDELTSRTGR